MLKQLILIMALVLPVTSFAEIISIGSNAKVLTRSNAPAIGMSKSVVLKKFGKPNKRQNSKGKITKRNPRISVWRYGKSTVYFERNHVIHTVHHY